MGSFETVPGRIWHGGKETLPEVANQYATFSNRIDTLNTDMGPFTAEAASDSLASVGTEFKALKRTLQQLMAESSTNLNRVGKALVEFAEDIDGEDTEASRELDTARRHLGEYEVYPYSPTYPSRENENHPKRDGN
ncbi:MAG: hypothetical protein ACRD0P_30495 [Stackebrandtia sp.]